MPLRMLDSIYVANLPPGADAYLGYVDGLWANWAAVNARFGDSAHIVSMAVFPGDRAQGFDREDRDITAAQIAGCVQTALAEGIWRPVVYASVSAMSACLAELRGAGIARQDVRLLSAHYEAGKHICGPLTCRYYERIGAGSTPACDGTQWRDDAAGAAGSKIDESVLADDFFGGDMPLTAADLEGVRKAVWESDKFIPPNPSAANPTWEYANALAQVLKNQEVILAAVNGDPAFIAAAVIAGLDVVTLAGHIEAALSKDDQQSLLDALAARLQA